MRIRVYIVVEWLKVFFITGILVFGMILVQEVYSRLGGLLSREATGWEILLVFLLSIPQFLPAVIPLVLLLSVLFSVSSMHRKNELVAMKAAGISLWQISQPLLLAALFCAGLILYLNATLIPWAVETQENLQREIHRRASGLGLGFKESGPRMIRNLGSLNFREQRLWLIGAYYPFENRGTDVTVYSMDEDGRELHRIRAASARWSPESGHWIFANGRELFYDGKTVEPYRNRSFGELEREDFDENPELMVALRKKPQDLSLAELREILAAYEGYDSPSLVPYRVRYYRILIYPLSCILVVGFGVPFAASGVRTNPMIGISKAFGMFILYFLISNIATILGDGGWIAPLHAALIPMMLIGGGAVWVFARAE